MTEQPAPKLDVVCELPNGCTLYREPNEVGGYRYWSDEIGGGVMVWDTCLVSTSTLLAAMTEELRRENAERQAKRDRLLSPRPVK